MIEVDTFKIIRLTWNEGEKEKKLLVESRGTEGNWETERQFTTTLEEQSKELEQIAFSL